MLTNNSYLRGLIVLLSMLLICCKGPLEKKYDPKTFSEDIKELSATDQKIIKNVISIYERNKESDSIGGSETVLIPSLTFAEIKSNYKAFHKTHRTQLSQRIKEKLKYRWAEKFNLPLLKNLLNKNLEIVLKAEKVRDPKNGYISREVVITNLFDKKIKFSGILRTSKKLTDNSNVFVDSIPLLSPNQSHIELINDIEFDKEYKPTEDTQLKITGLGPSISKSIDQKFKYGQTNYSASKLDLLETFGKESLYNKIQATLENVPSLVEKKFNLTIWPHNTSKVSSLESEILNSQELEIN